MTLPQFLRGAARIVACVAAVAALCIAGKAALQDQTATASAAGAIGLALMVLAALDLESFEGLGIKAKLRNTLSDAEDKVKGLDKISLALARSTIVQASRGNLRHKERMELITELTEALKDAKVDDLEIQKIKGPFYRFLAYKYWYGLGYVRSMYQARHANYVQQIQMRTPPGSESDRLLEEFKRLSAVTESDYPTDDNFIQLREFLSKIISKYPLAIESDRAAFESIASDLSDMFEGCLKAGNYTPEAFSAIEQLGDPNSPLVCKFLARLSAPSAQLGA